MKKAIAMKCNKEQFESIREKLVGFHFKNVNLGNGDFYLVNNFLAKDNHLAAMRLRVFEKRQYYEKWDENIFLDACGIEPTMYARDYEYFHKTHQRWEILTNKYSETLLRLKPTHDYSKEIESLQDKAKENGMKAIITFEKR